MINHVNSIRDIKDCENAKKFPHSAILGFETSFTTNNSDLSSLALPYLTLCSFVPTVKLMFGG